MNNHDIMYDRFCSYISNVDDREAFHKWMSDINRYPYWGGSNRLINLYIQWRLHNNKALYDIKFDKISNLGISYLNYPYKGYPNFNKPIIFSIDAFKNCPSFAKWHKFNQPFKQPQINNYKECHSMKL